MTHDDDTAMGRVVTEWLRETGYTVEELREDSSHLNRDIWPLISRLLDAIAAVLEAREDA